MIKLIIFILAVIGVLGYNTYNSIWKGDNKGEIIRDNIIYLCILGIIFTILP